MKSKLINILKTILLVIIFSMTGTSTCYADVDINALQGYFNGVISQQQINQSNNPKYAERSHTVETVDPITGNLILKQTDLTLPGKNGLDLSIARIYNSSQDEYVKKCKVTLYDNSYSYVVEGYVLDILIYDKVSQTSTIMHISSDDIFNLIASYEYYSGLEDEVYIYVPLPIREESYIVYVTDYSIVKSDYTDKYSYNKTRYYLGAGWSFAYPSVQIEKDNNSTFIYYHDGSGAAYRVINTTNTGKSNLEGYQGNDVRFLEDNGSYVNLDGIPSKYKFINSDLTTTFFANDGRLLGIRDRLNNEIKFRHQNVQIYGKTYPLISQIIDSVGRTINFTYVNDNIEVTVSAPNETNQIKLTYARYFSEQSYYNNGVLEEYKYPILDYVIDPLGKKTYYVNYYYNNNNTWPTESFSYTSKNITGANERTRYLLWGIVYPGSKTLYEYEKVTRNLGADGVTSTYRVKSRHDEIQRYNNISNTWDWLKDNNCIEYTYSGDCSGFPTYNSEEAVPTSYQFWSEASSANDLKVRTTFNGKKQLLQVETTASNNEKQVIKNVEFDKNYNELPTKIEYTDHTSDGTLAHTYLIGKAYTSWGGISSETNKLTELQYNNAATKSKYTTTYYYDNPTYKYFVTKKQWYQNDFVLLSESYNYDSLGRIASFINAKGEITNYNYYTESNNNVEEVTKQLENGKIAKTKTVYGSETGYAYPKEIISIYTDDQGVLNETKTTRTYNMLLGQVLTETDNENKTTSYSYDYYGRITLIQQPDFTNISGDTYAVRQEYSYIDGHNWDYLDGNYWGIYGTTVNTCTVYVNKADNTLSYYNQLSTLYDAYGNLMLEKNRSTGVTQSMYTYDNMQRVISSIDAIGNTVTQSYDPWGLVKEVTDSFGNLYVSDYDILNNMSMNYFIAKDNIAAYRANMASNVYKENYVELLYDQFGRNVERKVYENWPTKSGELSERYNYDFVGNLTGYTDPKRNLNKDGVTTTYQYDSLNRIVRVRDAMNQITNIYYTILGEIESITLNTDASSTTPINLYTKSYNELGNVISKTDNKGYNKSYYYNSIGLNTKAVDRNRNVETLSYDGNNQLIEKTMTSPNGISSYKYSYTNPFGPIDVNLYNNGAFINRQHYYYNTYGQVTQRDSISSYCNSSLKLQYDTVGRLISIGTRVSYSNYFYSSYKYTNDRLTQVQTDGQQSNSTEDKDNVTYEYYPDGKLKKITYPKLNDNSNLTTEYSYNPLGRMTSVINKKGSVVLSQFTYTYDANGNIISVNDGKTTKTYVYDKLNRLIEIQPQIGSKTIYTYDLRGNRRMEVGGNFNLDLDISYSYDEENKLQTVTKGTTTTSMKYYADGMRAKKETTSGYTNYVYDLSGKVVAEAEDSSSVTSNYVWGPDRVLVKKVVGGGEYYYLYNGHGDVIQIVDTNGKIVNNYQYDEWGNILECKETISNPFKYAGEIYDQETGLYYLRARYYDPSIGRFINEDSFEGQVNNPLTLNLYTYCFNNPGIYVDRSGNFPFLIVTGLIGAVVGGVVGGVKSYIQTGEVSLKSVVAGAAIGGGIGLTGGAATAYLTTGSALASTGTVVSSITAMYASTSALVIKGIDSVWKLNPFERGNEIEKALGGWCNNFPVIDKAGKIVNGFRESITSIKSMDLFAKSYQNGNSVYNTVMKYVNSLANFTSTKWGSINVDVNSSTRRYLELAIPKGGVEAQMTQINNAIAEAAQRGVEIIIRFVK
ncbi:hypothetical protein KQI61_17975 [Anaerocolumna aminovalerica]|uniref:RHS repeat-associated core domain-containing protein n=1 Tax=Anaerocolumna aminovalerica TaxID=1527 RepID=UPI001C0F2727|nr:RHS repeat-associated core domain-containing protein [Anaerocolumna aminovalerica]MBU5334084.1 hypothetical protein [Anaerocolumna aminovalerica]